MKPFLWISIFLAIFLIASGATLLAAPPDQKVGSDTDLKRYLIYASLPEYPYEGRLTAIQGIGNFRADVDETGKVKRVEIMKSTGYKAVDDAAVKALSRSLA